MASKLEYLQRYMSSSGGDAGGDKKKKKKVKKTKKTKSATLGTRIVDADDAWEQSAPSREDIEQKWEQDAAEDELPLLVAADGEQLLDPQDLPVYVDSDKYLDEFRGKKKQKEDGDLSPPRKKKAGVPRGRDSSEDKSPPRRPKRERRSDAAQESRRRGDSGEDVSPPRKQRRGSRDASPPRRGQDDASPPRRRATQGSISSSLRDASPPRRGRDDASPPRRAKKETESLTVEGSDERDSKREERKRRSSSPSRAVLDRQRRVDSLGRDILPRSGRSKRRSSSLSKGDDSRRRDRKPTRSRGRARDRSRDASASPTRRKGRESRSRGRRRSPSPPRRSRSRSNSPKHRSSRRESKRERSPDGCDPRKSAASSPEQKITREPSKRDDKNIKKEIFKADGKDEKKAGLFTATEFEAQRKVAARRKDLLHGVDASEMGANAETVYRDKRGRKLDMLNEMVRQQEVLDGKRKREEREEYEWGTGEVQKRERKSKQELIEQMKKTPFARHEDDEELERKRRERVRAFDPMNSKTFQEDPLADEGKSKKKKSMKDKKKTSKAKPKYAGPPAPPNRFGIMPGYRWDGVVRGTNWEEKIMMRQNANTALSEDAYKYAVADM